MATRLIIPTSDHAETMARLHVGSMREAYEEIVPSEVLANLSISDLTTRWRGYLEAAGYPVAMAQVDGEPAGLIRTGTCPEPLDPRPDGHIFQLYVLKRFYRAGVGRRLLCHVASGWLARRGTSLSVGVLAANQRANAFYTAMGARRVLETTFEWDGHSLAESIYLFENLEELSRFA